MSTMRLLRHGYNKRNTKFPHEGGKPEVYTPEQMHQLSYAGWLGGTSDLHNKNIVLEQENGTKRWSAKLYDLESMVPHPRREFIMPANGTAPSRRQVLISLYRKAMRGHSAYAAKLLAVDEREEIARAATDSAWHLQRYVKDYHKKNPALQRGCAGIWQTSWKY